MLDISIPKGLTLPILQGPAKGMRWIVGSFHHGCYLGSYELEKQKELVKYLLPGMVVYDIGAHVGFYTLLFSKLVGIKGYVYAFEPFPSNFTSLEKHFKLNKLDNVKIEQCAVSNDNSELIFFPSKFSAQGSIIKNNQYNQTNHFKVNSLTIDNYVYNLNNLAPDFIKMDIEGAEYLACLGMQRILKEKKPIIFMALHGVEIGQKCYNFLRCLNYTLVNLEGKAIIGSEYCDEIIALPTNS